MMELMLRALIVGGIATIAAFVLEQALLHARMPTRYAWTLALALTLVLPFVPRVTTDAPTYAIPAITAPAVVVTTATEVEAGFPFNPLRVTWLLLSALALIAYLRAYARLRGMQRTWSRSRVADADVLLSESFGPAIFGFARPRIVVPQWVTRSAADEQTLIVLHEREHIRAGDQLQLLFTLVGSVLMPWNPFVWLQSRRLGFRLETDCDRRVLNAAPDAHRYATLLINVGARQTGLLLTPALAEERSGLERRLQTMGKTLIENRWKAAGLMVIAAGLTVVACESRLPQDPAVTQQAASPESSERSLPRKQQVDADALIVTKLPEYPPLVREAGIGGITRIKASVTGDGKHLSNYRVTKSAGHEALDRAALKSARELEKKTGFRTGEPIGEPNSDYEIAVIFEPAGLQRQRAPDTAVVLPSMKLPDERHVDEGRNQEPQQQRVEDKPVFTPYNVKPELRNRAEIVKELARNYPPVLRDAGIEGTALVWVLLDERGNVQKAQLKETAGRAELDAAAVYVARKMKFSPAEYRGRPVKVWIQLPIVFKTT